MIQIWQKDIGVFDLLFQQSCDFLIHKEMVEELDTPFLMARFLPIRRTEGLASCLFVTVAITSLFLRNCLTTGLGRLTALGFGVLFTDSFVCLGASINL